MQDFSVFDPLFARHDHTDFRIGFGSGMDERFRPHGLNDFRRHRDGLGAAS